MPKKGFTGIIDLASNREDIQTQKLDTSSKNEVSSMPSYPQNSTKVAENTHKTVPQNKENAASKIPEHGEKNGSGAKDIFLIFLAMLAIIIGVYWYSTSDYAAWKEALSQDSLAGYRKYVSVKVDGAHVKEANAHIKEIQNQMLSRIVPPYNKKDIVGFLKDFPDFDTNKLEDDVVNDMVKADSFEYYKEYKAMFPNGKCKVFINHCIKDREQRLIEKIKTSDDEADLVAMRAKSSLSQFWDEIDKRITELYNDFNFVKKKNTKEGLIRFLHQNPKSEYYHAAIVAIWQLTCEQNTKNGYEDFVQNFPTSSYVDMARKKIIDFEVADIGKQQHGTYQMTSPQASGYGYGSRAQIDIENKTAYQITVRYSGPDTTKIQIPAYGTIKMNISVGHYHIAVTTKEGNVHPFYGENDIKAGHYLESFYIEHRRSYNCGY